MAEAPYKRIYRILKTAVQERKLLPGVILPGEICLAESYQVSRPTVRKALQMLAAEGLMECHAGVGWSVLSSDPPLRTGRRRELVIGTDLIEEDWEGAFYYRPFLRGMRHAAENQNCRLQLIRLDPEKGITPGPVDAAALARTSPKEYSRLAQIAGNGTPVILLNRMPPQQELAYLSVDYREEARRAVEYLILIGHRKIAVVSESPDSMACAERTAGWRSAFQQNHLPIPEELNWQEISISGLEEFLRRNRPTALFVTSGRCVVPTLLAAERARMRIPEDLSFFSFDDTGAACLTDSMISCVKMPLETMGEQAVDYLCRRCDNPAEQPIVRKILSATLAINESCQRVEGRES